MKILITGITGFVGSTMADYLCKKFRNDLHIFGMKRWRSDDENILHLYNDKRITFLEGDLLDRTSLSNVLKKSTPDYIFHFAAQSYPRSSFDTPVSTLMTNVIGTTNLMEELLIARNNNICDPIIISVSSSEVYGNPTPEEIPIKESNPIRAANPYSISKVGHDLMSQYYHKGHGLKIIITRMFSHEGWRRGKIFALSNFAYQIVRHEKYSQTHQAPFNIYVGNLDSVRTYSHIDDAVNAYWLCAEKGHIGEIYNIGGTYTTTVGEVLLDLERLSHHHYELFNNVVDPERIRPTDITLQIPDCSKFKEHTGWAPHKTIHHIISDLLNYWRVKL